jgi:hypothetical protein
MARISKQKVTTNLLGFSPEALQVNALTTALMKRTGIYHCLKLEMASYS